MNYRIGNYKEIKAQGETELLTCPTCNQKVNLSVFSNGEMRLIPKFPIIKNATVYFLICPKCSAVYGVDETLGKNFEKGEKLSIGNFDLKELKQFEV